MLHQHQRHRLADNIAGAHDDDVLAFERDIFVFKELEHAVGCARWEDRAADHKSADVVEMESIDVLVRGNGVQDTRHVEGARQRQLNQAMDGEIVVKLGDLGDWRMASSLCIGGTPAAFAGAWAVSVFDSRLLAGCLGLLTLLSGLNSLRRRTHPEIDRASLSHGMLFFIGAASGFLSSLTG